MKRLAAFLLVSLFLPLLASAQIPAITTWAAGMDTTASGPGISSATGLTFRNKVRIAVGGIGFRFTFSNQNGTTPLTIGAASAGASTEAEDGTVSQSFALKFSGSSSVIIPAGGFVASDPILLPTPKFSIFYVSTYVPSQTIARWTYHEIAKETNYVAAGDQTNALTMTGSTVTTSWWFLKSVEAETRVPVIVAIGDSITDGFKSTADVNARWPDYLADNLWGRAAVANVGISGNEILASTASGGPSELAREQNDVFDLAGVKYVIDLEGVNDIAHGTGTADQIIAAKTTFIDQAHARGIRVYEATIMPASILNSAMNTVRATVNTWIRTSGVPDGVVDFDTLMADPSNPLILNPAYDSGDGIHPNDAGDKVMGDSINVNLIQ
jgi:lysophospholipase L1-like esterase